MYGIGCSLDSGGVRFCTVLILIAHQLATNKEVTSSKKATYLYIGAFLIISIIGNMVARTTTVGMLLGLGYMAITIGLAHRAVLTRRQVIFWSVFLVLQRCRFPSVYQGRQPQGAEDSFQPFQAPAVRQEGPLGSGRPLRRDRRHAALDRPFQVPVMQNVTQNVMPDVVQNVMPDVLRHLSHARGWIRLRVRPAMTARARMTTTLFPAH